MFRLRWKQAAQDNLTDIWLAAPSERRKTITQTIYQVEQGLKSSPTQIGESRSGKLRILFESSLGILYEVDEEKNLVTVAKVWQY